MLQKGYVWSHVCFEIRLFGAVVTSFINMLGFLILHISILPRIPQSVCCRFLICGSFGGRTIGALEMFDPDTWTHKSFRPFTAPGTPCHSLGPRERMASGVTAGGWVVGGFYYPYTIPYSTQYNVYCILYYRYTIDSVCDMTIQGMFPIHELGMSHVSRWILVDHQILTQLPALSDSCSRLKVQKVKFRVFRVSHIFNWRHTAKFPSGPFGRP